MMRFQWNSLRIADRVIVHDPSDPNRRPVSGVVVTVARNSGLTYGSNDLGIRIASHDAAGSVVSPARMSVHRDRAGETGECRRCVASAAS